MAKLQSGTRIYGTANVDSSLAVGGVIYAPGNIESTSNTTGTIVVTGGIGATGNVNANNIYIRNDLFVGTVDGNPLGGATNPIIASIGNTDNYIQTYQINYANTANASSDFALYPNNGIDANGWIDLGITSNSYACTAYSVTGRNEGYLFMSAPGGSGTSGNLVIATDSTGLYNSIEFVVGGFNKGKSNSNVKFTTATSSTSNTTGTVIVTGGVGITGNLNSGNITSTGSANVLISLVVGTANGASLGGATNPTVAVVGNSNNYIQTYQINYSNTQFASSDFIAYPNNGNDSNGWIDMGITSNVYSQAAYSVTGRNEGYIFMSAPGGSGTSGNLVIATDSTGIYNAIEFVAGGFNRGKSNTALKVDSVGIGFAGKLTESLSAPTISTNTLTLNLNASSVFNVALNANITTLTIQNPPASGVSSGFVLIFTADGTPRSVTWPASVKWPDASAPSLTSTNTKKDVFTFFTIDGGTTWNAFVSGQGM